MNTKKTFIALVIVVVAIAGAVILTKQREGRNNGPEQKRPSEVVVEKVYVAIEGEGRVAVIDPAQKKVLSTIDLKDRSESPIAYMAHNVQVAPDGKSVWVTANAMAEDAMGGGHADKETGSADQVIIIDPLIDQIVRRIQIATDSHLAHVALALDSKKAYITAQETGLVYTINAESFAIEKTASLGEQSGPHGLRVSPLGDQVFIALLDGKALAVLNTLTNKVQKYPFESGTVQTAVTPDGRFAFVSLYSTKQIAKLDRATGKIEKINLPSDAKGPVQLYPTPDSRFIYVADQGYYFDQPTGDKVYRLAVEDGAIDQTITAGTAPHGVVVDSAGEFVYVTNLLSDDLSIIEGKTGKEIARIPIGDMPNGISIWNSASGGTP